MFKKNINIFFCILLCFYGKGFGTINKSSIGYPEITFKYDWRSYVMDFFGSLYFGAPVTEDLENQLVNRLPLFIAAWEREAPLCFGEVISTFQRGIKADNRTAIINLSHGSSYGSHRFLIFGLRRFLDPETWLAPISKEDAFSVLVFHELLHIWVDENINKDLSSILAKYRHEEDIVLDHVHLMAIQKMVYLKSNRPDLLDFIDECYRLYQGPLYRYAWEIVNDIEGYEAVLRDIVIK